MLRITQTLLTSALISILAASSAVAEDDIPPELAREFAEMDRNKDGKLQRKEWHEDDQSFREADRDRSGGIDLRELARFVRDGEHDHDDEGDMEEEGDLIEERDKDGDGALSREEAKLPAREFKKMDRDGNGKVDREELTAFHVEEHVNELFVEHDADLSGTLSLKECPEDLKEAFTHIDANKDGQLTGKETFAFLLEQELEGDGGHVMGLVLRSFGESKALTVDTFPASPSLFKRVDRDRDGKVTREEARRYLRHGQRIMERLWSLHERIERAGQLERLGPLVMEAEALFSSGRYEELPEVIEVLRNRFKRSTRKKRPKRMSKGRDY